MRYIDLRFTHLLIYLGPHFLQLLGLQNYTYNTVVIATGHGLMYECSGRPAA